MLNKNKKIYFTVIIVLAVVLGYTICVYNNRTKSNLPTVSVGMHVQEILEDNMTLTWIVQNRSEQLLTFDENNIMQVKLNGQEVLYPTESATLEPGEQVSIDLELDDLNVNTSNKVQITACSNEGTKATFCKTIRTYQNNTK